MSVAPELGQVGDDSDGDRSPRHLPSVQMCLPSKMVRVHLPYLGFALQIKCLTLRFSCYTSFLWLCNKRPQIQCLKTILLYCLSISVVRKEVRDGWIEVKILVAVFSAGAQGSFASSFLLLAEFSSLCLC